MRGSTGLPVLVVNTRPVSTQQRPRFARSASWAWRRAVSASIGQPDQREVAAARMGLDRADVQLALDALDLLADVQLVAVQVDVLPA